ATTAPITATASRTSGSTSDRRLSRGVRAVYWGSPRVRVPAEIWEVRSGELSDQALWPDAADVVRDFGARLRDAAAGAGQHRRHPVRRRGHDRHRREGAARDAARAR